MRQVRWHRGDVFRDLNGILAPIAKAKGLNFSFESSEYLKNLLLKGDYLSVLRILVNLGSNALKFTDSGRVNILIEPIKQEDGKIVIKFSVVDTGSGISDEEKAKLFERFSRLDRHSSVEGSGIGLNSSFQKVLELGGELTVASEIEKGSAFSFTIPVDVLEQKASSARAASPVVSVEAAGEIIEIPSHIKAKLPILVVDDNKMSRKLLIHQLIGRGFKNIYQASNGADAEKDVLINNYFLIITDQNMGEGKLQGYLIKKYLKNSYKIL